LCSHQFPYFSLFTIISIHFPLCPHHFPKKIRSFSHRVPINSHICSAFPILFES
jgi:hypothetical protein